MVIKFNWKLTIFSLFFLALFIRLGFWQMERGYEKEASIIEDNRRRNLPGVQISNLPTDEKLLDGFPVSLSGEYETSTYFLLDNVVLDGKVGYEVLVPFLDNSGTNVLVNRGFVPMAATRAEIPMVPMVPSGELNLEGNIYVRKSKGPKTNFMSREMSPFLIQAAEPERLEATLKKSLYPYVVRLSEKSTGALPRYWPLTAMSPDRHFGYVLTWFSMAIAITIAFCVFTFRKEDAGKTQDEPRFR